MTDAVVFVIFAVVAYLLGSINTGILVSKLMYNDDVRRHGSGNAGATNILRVYGKKAAAITVIGDALKGIFAVLLVKIAYVFLKDFIHCNIKSVEYVAAAFAVLGHNFPIYFNFKGGKGVLTSIAVIMLLDPMIGLITLCIAIFIMAITKYVSLGSVIGAVTAVGLSVFLRTDSLGFVVLCTFLAALVIYRHRGNIYRLAHGTEAKLGRRSK